MASEEIRLRPTLMCTVVVGRSLYSLLIVPAPCHVTNREWLDLWWPRQRRSSDAADGARVCGGIMEALGF